MKNAAWLSAVGTLSLSVLSAPALAQQAGPESLEIVVTAQKREQALADVPLPVQAFSAAQLEDAGATKVSDLVKLIPGASVVSSTTPGFETIQIRGISSGTTGDGLVGYYIDETPFGIPNLQLTPPAGLLDVARVEVVRGPSGTLYGQGSMGGTIKVVTNQPDASEVEGELQVSASNTEDGEPNYTVGGVLNLPIVRDLLAVRIAGSYDELGGYAEFDDVATPARDGEDVNSFKGANIRATALLTPTPEFDVGLTYWRIDNQQDGTNTLNVTRPDPTIVTFDRGPGFIDVEMDLWSLTANWDLGAAVLTSNSSYIEHRLDFDSPLDIPSALLGAPVTLPAWTNDSTFETESFTQEVRLTSSNDEAFKWLVGGFYRDAEIHSDIDFFLDLGALGLPGFVFPAIDAIGPLSTKSWSVFGEASLELFNGKLVPLVGLRYFEDEREAEGLDRVTLVRDRQEAKWDSLTPRFNLTYNATEDALVFINVAKGFRSGTLQTDAQAAAADTTLGLTPGTTPNTVEPDELWTYEIGGRFQTADRTLLLEASIFQTDWEGAQTQFGGVASIINGGDYEIRGVDLGVLWRTPVDGLTLQAVGNFNDTEISNAPPALAAQLAGVRNGARIPNVPEYNYTLAASYSRGLDLFGGSTMSLYSGYAYRAEQLDANRGTPSGDVEDLTLRAGLEKDNWKIEAFALNALNDDSPAVLAPVTNSYQILYPRRIGVQVGLKF